MRSGSVALLLAAVLAGCAGPSPRAFAPGQLTGSLRIAVLPLSNFSATRDAADHLRPILGVELSRRRNIWVADDGQVEEVLARDPWMLTDRIPPDLVNSFGNELGVDALLVGSILAYGFREEDGERFPQMSISLRLLETPGGRVLWNAVHSRDGADRETVFGFGRVHGLEQLATETVREILATLPQLEDAIPGTSAGRNLETAP